MIPKECKRLAEVDFPIAVVSKHSAREKAIRHGHPATLHLWWARRPLAACRSMLMALLLPDPCDANCPEEFKARSRELLNRPMSPAHAGKTDEHLRQALLKIVGDIADWDQSAQPIYLEISRGLVAAAHPNGTPLVVDPFAGGGAIPLEALRLGCDACASDLNPVACLINKVMLEDIPRHGPELAEELRRVGAAVNEAATRELAEFYPKERDGAMPIAYLWARTVRCEAPNCGAEIPLVRSFWLGKKTERRSALRTKEVRPAKGVPRVEFEIFTPTSEKEVRGGTVSRAKATCVCCKTTLHPDRVRAQLAAQRGGADVVFNEHGKRIGGAMLLAVVTLREGDPGRHYRLSIEPDYAAVWKAQKRVLQIAATRHEGELRGIPDEPTPKGGGSGAGRAFSYRRYGMLSFRDLFTARQALVLATIAQQIKRTDEIRDVLCLALGKLVDLANAICRWEPVAECPRNVFAAGRVRAAWEFAEGVVLSESSGSFAVCVDNLIQGMLSVRQIPHVASVSQAESQESPLPDASASVWFTDPPYYDAYPYADLADGFLVWLSRAGFRGARRNIIDKDNPTLSPKNREIVQDESRTCNGRTKDRAFFEDEMCSAFAEGRRLLDAGGIGCIVFAHKTTEGWEALLTGIIAGGLTITASWPIATEQAHRLRAKDSAALATSVHLVCRPRPENAPIGDWGQVLRELPRRVADWMERLQAEGVRGADLVFACIGPALEVYSRYAKVVDAEEREIPLGGDPESRDPHRRGFLAYVWEVVGRAALEQVLGTVESRARNGAAGALEEDARLTALFLWTLQATTQDSESASATDDDEDTEPVDEDEEDAPSSKKKKKGMSLPFDVARRFAQPLGIHLDAWEGRCIETEKGIVRLISVVERAKQLFGDDGAEAVADRLEKHVAGPIQQTLFAEMNEPEPPAVRGRRRKAASNVSDESLRKHRGATTLDHVHAAMLLQASGRANALRALLKAETERGPDFVRLANALSALYPKGSDEKRLVDAMLLAVPK